MSIVINKKRITNTTVSCPIIYGSIAFYLGKRSGEYATHRWTLFIRGPNNENVDCFISKVMFSLHPSFQDPTREILKPPFEVTETGWGEFEVSITIHFKDEEEEPITFFHQLKLYPPGPPQPLTTKKPVVSERYDEIVFTNPTESFYKCLLLYTPPINKAVVPNAEFLTIFDDEKDLAVLSAIHNHLNEELTIAKSKLLQIESEIAFFQDLELSAKLTIQQLPTSSSIASSNSAGSTSFIPGTTIPAVINNSGSNSLLTTGSSKRADSKSRSRNPRPSKKKKETLVLSTDSINIDTTNDPTSHPTNNTIDSNSDTKIDISTSVDSSTTDTDSKAISSDNQTK